MKPFRTVSFRRDMAVVIDRDSPKKTGKPKRPSRKPMRRGRKPMPASDKTKTRTDSRKPAPGPVGLDVGTMNLVSARMDGEAIKTSSLRNVFLRIPEEFSGQLDLDKVSYARIEGSLYVLSEEAFTFANIFNQEAKRPMREGMISPDELDSADVLAVMVRELLGEGGGETVCCYSIPADPVDKEVKVVYHRDIFRRIIGQLGYRPVPLNEGVAIVYSECADEDFTGIGVSFGGGMTNVGVSFRGVQVLAFSCARGGDWIDRNAAASLGQVPNRLTLIKEREDFDLNDFSGGRRKERRMKEALTYYYRDLIGYTVRHIVAGLDGIDTDFPDEVPLVISGGTAKARGFAEAVSEEIEDHEFPFDVKGVRLAENPLTATAEGCLINALKE